MHPNEQLLRSAIDAVKRGDMASMANCISEDVVIHFPGKSKLGGDHHGRGSLGARVRELTGNPLGIETDDVCASDRHAVGIYRFSATRGDERIEWRHMNVYRVENGLIVEVWQNPFEQDLVDDFFA